MHRATRHALPGSTAWLVLVCACGDDAMPPDDAGTTMTTFSREELLDPETCKDCHARHYREWASSMHAYAAEDPVFLAMNQRGQEQTGGELGEFCVNCHAPMAVREGATKDGLNLDEVPDHLKGVTCYFCHNVESVTDDHNNPLVLADDTTMRGGIANAKRPKAHDAAYSKLLDGNTQESSTLCGSCHDIVTPGGVHLERTFAEWKKSVFSAETLAEGGLSCNRCHMSPYPGVAADDPDVRVGLRDVHEHLWASVDVALTPFPDRELQREAVMCSLSGAVKVFSLTVTPLGTKLLLEGQAGHHVPSGASQDRRLWVEVMAYDDAGTLIFRSGDIADDEVEEKPADHPNHDPNLWIFRDWIYDENGDETHMFWEARKSAAHPEGYESNTMPPLARGGGPHTVEKNYEIVNPARVTVRLRMRPMGLDVLDDLIDSGHLDPTVRDAMPTHTLEYSQVEWQRDRDGFGTLVSAPRSDAYWCAKYRCRLDPTSGDCPDGE
jgi:hypothetical protein